MWRQLIQAVHVKDTQRLKLLLEDDNTCGYGAEWVVIQKATAQHGSSVIIRLLLEGAEQGVTAKLLAQFEEWTVLHYASRMGNSMLVMLLLDNAEHGDHRTSMIGWCDSEGWTALHYAARHRHVVTVRLLLEYCKPCERSNLVVKSNKENWTALHYAVQYGNILMVRMLLDNVNPNERTGLIRQQNDNESTALHIAACYGTTEVAKLLLEKTDRIERTTLIAMRDKKQKTAMHIAVARYGNAEMVELLLQQVDSDERTKLISQCGSYVSAILPTNITEDPSALPNFLSTHMKYPALLSEAIKLQLSHKRPSMKYILELIQLLGGTEVTNTNGVPLIEREELKPIKQWLCENMVHAAATTDPTKKLQNDDTVLHVLAAIGDYELFSSWFHHLSISQAQSAITTLNSQKKTVKQVATGSARRFLSWYEGIAQAYYPIDTCPSVIISYSTVDRVGAEKEHMDISSCLHLWLQSNFKMLANSSKVEILAAIEAAGQTSANSAQIVVLMGHGKAGHVHTADGKWLKIQDVLDKMASGPHKHTPKVLIVQACQQELGGGFHRVSSTDSHDSTSTPDSECDVEFFLDAEATSSGSSYVPKCDMHFTLRHRHMAILVATSHGTTAQRNLMIPLLAKHLKEHNGDIYEAFLKTNSEIGKRCGDYQVPVMHSTLDKKLCLSKAFEPDTRKSKSSVVRRMMSALPWRKEDNS